MRDSRDRFYLIEYQDPTRVIVYDADGSYLKTIGRDGSGPGEFRSVVALRIGVNDSLYTYDPGLGRLTVFDASGAIARTGQAHGRIGSVILLPDGRQILNASISTQQSIGLPLHTTDRDGNLELSYGSDGVFLPGRPQWNRQMIWHSNGDEFWAAHRYQLVIDKWTADAQHLIRIIRRNNWFPAYAPRDPISPQRPSPPLTMAITEARDNLIFLVVAVAHSQWRKVLPTPIEHEGRLIYPASTGDGVFESRFEVINTDAGQLLLAESLSQEILGFLDEEHVYSYRVDAAGLPHVEIWRVRFQVP